MLRIHFFALALLAAISAAPAQQEAPDILAGAIGRTVSSIEFETSGPLDEARLLKAVSLNPGATLSRGLLKRALQNLYDTGRIDGISVDGVPQGNGIRLRFTVRQSYLFNRFSTNGNLPLSGRALWEVVSLPVGERVTSRAVDRVVEEAKEYLRGRGYYSAAVKAEVTRDDLRFLADMLLVVESGRRAAVGEIEFTGVTGQFQDLMRQRLGLKVGAAYDPSGFRRRVDSLRSYLVNRGYLAVSIDVAETFRPETNSVGLRLAVANIGKIRVAVEGFDIPKDRLRRLLPVFSGAGLNAAVVEEGLDNIRQHLEDQGYPFAYVTVQDVDDGNGGRRLTYRVEPGSKVTVASVQFLNNQSFDDTELAAIVRLKPAGFLRSSAYSAARFEADTENLLKFYRSRGYLGAKVIGLVEPVDGARKLRLTFELDEGQLSRTGEIRFDGNSALADSFLRSRTRLHPGGPFSPQLAEADRQAVLAAYNDAGFLDARVVWHSGDPAADGTLPLRFEIVEGNRTVVGQVIVLGNTRTRRSVVERRIDLHSGDPLSLGKMLQTQQSLYNLGVFDRVRVEQQNPESAAPTQNVMVRLEETDQVTIRYGIGYQEREKLRGTVEVSQPNFLGIGQRANFRVRMSGIEQGAALTFEEPQVRFLPVNSYLSLSGRYKQEVSFDSRKLNLSYQFSRPVAKHSWALMRYNARNVRVSNLKLSPSELERTEAPRNLSTVSAIFLNDSRDNYIDPESGFFASADLSMTTKLPGFPDPSSETVPGGGAADVPTNTFLSLFTQSNYFRKLSAGMLLGVSLRVGLIRPFGTPDIPISERYFAGGASSLRGFDTDRAGPLDSQTFEPVGGNALLIGNVELRVPLFRALQAAAFYDVGNVYKTIGSINMSDLSHTIGVGLRLRTPFGPLRADLGYNLNLPLELRGRYQRRQLFLTIGPPF